LIGKPFCPRVSGTLKVEQLPLNLLKVTLGPDGFLTQLINAHLEITYFMSSYVELQFERIDLLLEVFLGGELFFQRYLHVLHVNSFAFLRATVLPGCAVVIIVVGVNIVIINSGTIWRG
jgi:hypothetical protein